MDSDSDSDGSHVSATPPRDFGPSSPPPPSRPPLISSTNSSVRARASSSSYSKPKKKFSHKFSSSPSHANPTRIDPVPASEDAFPAFLANLPFQIRSRPSDQNREVSAVDRSLETLPAGFFSKSASFSKIRRSTLNFDRVEDDPSPSSAPIPPPKADEITVPECSAAGWLPEELNDEAAVGYGISSAKVAKKHSNLRLANN